MFKASIEEPEYVDFVGVVLGRGESGKYNVFRAAIVDGHVTLSAIRYGNNRVKKAAVRVATLDLIGISQEITRGTIEFVQDLEDA